MRRLPPLNSIRAFEATARHLSFSKAADELNVTPGAVSQQVKVLEEYLDLKLFKRKNRQILLTDEAQICLPLLSQGLDKLSQGIDSIREQSSNKPLTITASNTFASRWLLPRLTQFHKEFPDISVRIEASNVLSDLVNDDIDIGIRFGDGDYPGLEADFLFSQSVIPVCHPSLLEGDIDILVPEDLKKHTLLHPGNDSFYLNDNTHIDWEMWFATVGVKDVDLDHGLRYEQYGLLIDAVLAGQGIALVGDSAVSDDLKAGRLIKLFENTDIKLNFSYYLAYSKSKANLPRLNTFRQWLLEQVKEMQTQEQTSKK